MNEAYLKGRLTDALERKLPGVIVQRHEDTFTMGIPDTSVTWRGYTSWIEAKHGKPRFKCKGNQKLQCKRLAAQGKCWFVVYQETKDGGARTLIVDPVDIDDLERVPADRIAPGFDHYFVVDFIKRQHDHNRA